MRVQPRNIASDTIRGPGKSSTRRRPVLSQNGRFAAGLASESDRPTRNPMQKSLGPGAASDIFKRSAARVAELADALDSGSSE